ncbi:hypothetical protein G4B88_022224 [Cannabis sativa]|uniref:CCHC-type domain-containing protein n=1 Tax=Cannabis sativa TaxID=3483 RepID=A0A7J6FYC5_CANSA|nr:hypothetical protein G4B88_022224 [Cannabis sativa]
MAAQGRVENKESLVSKDQEKTVRRGFLRCWIDVWLSHPIPAGFFFKSGSNLEVWIQFKYEKLPFLCFNCGKLAHSNRECLAPTAWVTPPVGAAVRMYGPWIKVEGPPGNCFSAASYKRELVLCDEGVKLTKENPRGKGRWTRRHGPISLGTGNDPAPATAVQTRSEEKGKRTREGMLHGTVHGGGRTDCTKNDEVAKGVGRNVVQRVVTDESRVEFLNIPPKKALVELPNPNFANVGQGEENEVLPDIGPSLIQSLDIPHIWTCKSQIPHHFPEPTNFKWPTNDPELQKLYCNLLGPDYTNMYQAQPSLIANPPNISEMIIHLLGSKKRKAQTWYQPIPEKLKESIFDNEGHDVGSSSIAVLNVEGDTDAAVKEVQIEPFNPGTSERRLKPRRRKGLRDQSTLIQKSNSGVKTRRGRKRIQEVTEGKMLEVTTRLVCSEFCGIPSMGTGGGGFCLAWKKECRLQIVNKFNSGFECCIVKDCNVSWTLFCMYGTPYGKEKGAFWQWISNLVQNRGGNWMVCGDLIAIVSSDEKRGGQDLKSSMGS